MAKSVIVAKNVENGVKLLFETVETAANELGMSATSVSTACMEGRECKGWKLRRADRIWALHLRAHNEWMLGVSNAKNDGWLEFENPDRKIAVKEVDRKKEITLGWYFQEGE